MTAVVIGPAFDEISKLRHEKPSTLAEAKRIIEEALEVPYPGTRMNIRDARVSSCMIQICKHDYECLSPSALQTYDIIIDLRRMSLATEFSEPMLEDGRRLQLVSVSPR